MKTTRFSFVVMIVLLLVITASGVQTVRQPIRMTGQVDVTTYVNANQILMFVTNLGNFGRDLSGVFGYDAGTFFPYTSIANIESGATSSPLYAAGLWLGGKIDGDVRVAISEYTSEYVPGPMSGGTFQADRPAFKVYKLHADSLAGNPNSDYLNWPVSQGAPLNAGGTPAIELKQTLWTVFNDADTNAHTNNAAQTLPLGIEVHHTASATDDFLSMEDQSIFMKYNLYNRSPDTIKDFYVALWADPDLGGYDDDLVGCDSLDNLFFCYNSSDTDSYYGSTPPAVGFKLIYGPVVPSSGDSAVFNGQWKYGYRNLEMTSFSRTTNGTDPNDYTETYNLLQGLTKSGAAYISPTTGEANSYMMSGDPVASTGDLDYDPSDRRMMGTWGPFDFNPGDSQFVVIKMTIGYATNRLTSIVDMRDIINRPYGIPTAVDNTPTGNLPSGYSLAQNYPNPFNPSTSIEYSLPSRSHVKITVHNVLGQEVTTLINTERPAGHHIVQWNGTDNHGEIVSTGIYLYRIEAGVYTETRKMMFVK